MRLPMYINSPPHPPTIHPLSSPSVKLGNVTTTNFNDLFNQSSYPRQHHQG